MTSHCVQRLRFVPPWLTSTQTNKDRHAESIFAHLVRILRINSENNQRRFSRCTAINSYVTDMFVRSFYCHPRMRLVMSSLASECLPVRALTFERLHPETIFWHASKSSYTYVKFAYQGHLVKVKVTGIKGYTSVTDTLILIWVANLRLKASLVFC